MPKQRPRSDSDRSRDLSLVERTLSGDQRAFEEIYVEYFPRVFAFCAKRVGDRVEAEDLAQETFVQLFRSLESFEGRSSLLTWTFGIAHNVCSRYFRHCSRWMVGRRDAREFEENGVESAIERRIDASRALERCSEVLEATRRSAHREIFQLRYGERKSIRSIAEQLGKSNDAVKVSLRRTRSTLSRNVPEIDTVLDNVAQSA
jgi:RNA polymerase sigma-70 factor (ECF subfamily)